MGTKYSSVAVSGYNASPPPDDGTVSEANKIKWSTIKTKLPDPLNTAIASINSNLTTHFNMGPTTISSNTTLGASHYNQFIQASGASVTLTLSDAATLGAGWYCWIANTDSSNSITLGRATGADTINGSAANYTIPINTALLVFVIAATNGFRVVSNVTTNGDNSFSPTTTNTFIGSVPVTLSYVDSGASIGPLLVQDRPSGSPAASDIIGGHDFNGRNSSAGTVTYVRRYGQIDDATASSEDGTYIIQTVLAGTLATRVSIGSGLVVGSPTGGGLGNGKVNAEELHVSNTVFAATSAGDVSASTISGTWVASQAQMEAASATDVIVTPGRVKYHPGVAKAWVIWDSSGTTILASYNVTSVTNTGTGDEVVNFTVAFSSTSYVGLPVGSANGSVAAIANLGTRATTTCAIKIYNQQDSLTAVDSVVGVVFFGDQ